MNLLLITIPQTKLINQNKRQRNRDSATIKRYTNVYNNKNCTFYNAHIEKNVICELL